MKGRLVLLCAGLVLTACQEGAPLSSPLEPGDSPEALQAPVSGTQPERVMPGEIVFAVNADVDASEVARAHGVGLAGRGHGNAFAVGRGAVGNEVALAARLRADPRVRYAEPNYLRQPMGQIDPRLWAFHNPGALTITYTRGGKKGQVVTSYLSTNDADLDAAPDGATGTYAAGGVEVLIGSIDTGVQMTHQEFLSGQLIAGKDWYSNDDDPSDSDGHGTHTTGTMVGRNVGIAGVSGAGSTVKVYVQRVCGQFGCPLSAIASAIRAAADQPNLVAMNLSLGGSSLSEAEAEAIDYATSKGVLVIASAGNGGTGTISCPACDPDAISVAALNWQDSLAYYSNWGSGLDISAPGGELYSNTTSEAGIYSSVIGGYAYYQGTSMAAPQVTGTAGVVASKLGLRGNDLRARLLSSTDDLGAAGYDTSFGAGRLNTYYAVTGTRLSDGASGGGGGGGGGGDGGSCVPRGNGKNCK